MKETLSRIKALKWIKSAKYVDGRLFLTTKKDVLRIKITHHYHPDRFNRRITTPLKQPIVVKLPSYLLESIKRVSESANSDGSDYVYHEVALSLIKRPIEFQGAYGRLFPTGSTTHWPTVDTTWRKRNNVCLGSYERKLVGAKDDYEIATILGEFLQIAIPDQGGVRNRSEWAYSMGILGDEIIQPGKASKKIQ